MNICICTTHTIVQYTYPQAYEMQNAVDFNVIGSLTATDYAYYVAFRSSRLALLLIGSFKPL